MTIKKHVGQEHKPYQAPYQQNQQNRPAFQGDYQAQRRNFNPRPFQPYNPNTTITSKELVPQNNVAQDCDWCYPFNQLHNRTACANGVRNQALTVQNINAVSKNTPDQNREQQDNIEVTLQNWQSSKFCGVNGQDRQDSPISANTRSKK